jgi:hypothetical protein
MTARRRARLGSPLRLHGSFELFGKSRKLIQKNIWIFAPLFALQLLFTFHAWEWTPALGGDIGHHWTRYSWFGSGFTTSVPVFVWYSFIGFSLLWLLFVVAIGTIVQIMVQEAQLEATEGKNLDFAHLWATAKELGWRMFGLYLLIGLYVVIGLILFIVPGIIMLRRYILAPYVMLDTKCSIKDAMEQSAEISKPYAGYVYGMIGVMTLIGLVNVVPGIGWMISFVLGFYYSAAPALRYQELKAAHAPQHRHVGAVEATEAEHPIE